MSEPDNTQEAGTEPDQLIRVFLLDDHEVVRLGVADLVDAQPDMQVVGQAGTADEALEVVEACQPSVAVLDVRLGEDVDGIEVCREIRSRFPDVECLILTSFADDQATIEAAAAGAAGYVLKQIGGNELIGTIRKVAAGAQLLDRAEVRMRMRKLRESDEGRVSELSDQEQRIFELIGDGLSNRQIAAQMFLAEKTVKNYVSNLFIKLGIDRRTQAAAMAARIEERERNRHS